MTKVGIHYFRKDLRTSDNLALNELAKQVDQVIGVFIYDQKQIKSASSNKPHYSIHSAQFIVDSVNDLNDQCNNKLIIAYGHPSRVIESLLKSIKPATLSFNSDFTPYSIKRDEDIIKVCEKNGVQVIANEDDQALASMKTLVKNDTTPYMVFGTFYKNLVKQKIPSPTTARVNWFKPRVQLDSLEWKPASVVLKGGRTEGLKILKHKITTGSADLLITKTSHMSAYLNQGCISIREVYQVFHKAGAHEAIRSISWRDFFLCIYRFSPTGNRYDKFIDSRYDKIKWPTVKQSDWKRFIRCDTGFLLIDAIMTELLQTGFINNRARLLLATFWIKYLLISPFDQEYGSQVGFSRLLVDCSACQNKLNHQWVVGDLDLSGRRFKMANTHPLTGRMIQIGNEVIKKYDPNYEYISKWLPQFQGKTLKECKAMMKQTKPMYEWRERYGEYSKLFISIERTKQA